MKIWAEVSKTKNFQKYTCGIEKEYKDTTSNKKIEEIFDSLQSICRKKCLEQLKLDIIDK